MTTTAPPNPYPNGTIPVHVPIPQDHLAPGARIRGAGVPVTLADGHRVHLRFSMAGIMALEEVFGSLGAARDALAGLDETKPVFSRLVDLLACALVEDLGGPEQEWQVARRRLRLGGLLDVADLQTYGAAAGEAFRQAFPAAAGTPSGGAEGPQATPTAPAPGTTGTTSAP